MPKHYKIEPLAGGQAHFSDISGKVQLVGFQKAKSYRQPKYRMEEQIDGSFCIWPNTPQGFEDAIFYRNATAIFPAHRREAGESLLAILNKGAR